MPATISEADFDVLVAKTGLPLSAAQRATLREVYPTFQAIIDRVSAPMPREAEPALIFPVEQR
jgi:hypothetical protein